VSLFAELKRRNVFRVAAAYAVVAWLLLQLADILLDNFGAPDWVFKSLLVVIVTGFLLALFLAWAYELTPEGVKRADEVTPELVRPDAGRRTDRLILVGALLVIVVLVVERAWFAGGDRPAAEAPTVSRADESAAPAPVMPAGATAIAAPEKSIAVLPFADFSPARDQEWFADGLAEEILNALARTPDLLVAARTSSFRYKASALDIPQIAAELGVAHVLEGSIRSTPQRIRVTAQLIRAADGFHVWSETYDRDPADMIEIQEDLARNIALAMQTSMDPQALADMAKVGTRSVEAYQAYIRGVAASYGGGVKESYELFERARALDPGFAAAHAGAANFWLIQMDVVRTDAGLTDLSPPQIETRFRERIRQAIESAPTAAERAGYEASEAQLELRWRKAIGLYQAYLAERPGDVTAKEALTMLAMLASERELLEQLLDSIWPEAQLRREKAISHVNHAHRSGNTRRAADQGLVLLERWPDDFDMLYQVHRALLWDGRVDVAAEVLERMRQVAQGDERWGALPPMRQACAEGRRDDAEQILANFDVDDISQRWHLLMLLGEHAAATELLMELERGGRIFPLATFMVFPHFDPSPFPSLMRILEREQIRRPPPVPLPFACPPRETGS
jgi:TolB-like protein